MPGDRKFITMRIERTDGRKGARGGAADAGIAMDDERRAAIPAAHEVEDLFDMDIRRRDKTMDRFGDIVDLDFEMIGRKHRLRPLHLIDIGHHGKDVTGAGGFDGVGQGGERADVDHGVPFVERNINPRDRR